MRFKYIPLLILCSDCKNVWVLASLCTLYVYFTSSVVANKPHMLDCDVINRILPHMHSEFSSVQFKLLGTMRMIIDGQGMSAASRCTSFVTWHKGIWEAFWHTVCRQMFFGCSYKEVLHCVHSLHTLYFIAESAATSLGTHEEFIKKLVSWCTVEGHAGVKG